MSSEPGVRGANQRPSTARSPAHCSRVASLSIGLRESTERLFLSKATREAPFVNSAELDTSTFRTTAAPYRRRASRIQSAVGWTRMPWNPGVRDGWIARCIPMEAAERRLTGGGTGRGEGLFLQGYGLRTNAAVSTLALGPGQRRAPRASASNAAGVAGNRSRAPGLSGGTVGCGGQTRAHLVRFWNEQVSPPDRRKRLSV